MMNRTSLSPMKSPWPHGKDGMAGMSMCPFPILRSELSIGCVWVVQWIPTESWKFDMSLARIALQHAPLNHTHRATYQLEKSHFQSNKTQSKMKKHAKYANCAFALAFFWHLWFAFFFAMCFCTCVLSFLICAFFFALHGGISRDYRSLERAHKAPAQMQVDFNHVETNRKTTRGGPPAT